MVARLHLMQMPMAFAQAIQRGLDQLVRAGRPGWSGLPGFTVCVIGAGHHLSISGEPNWLLAEYSAPFYLKRYGP